MNLKVSVWLCFCLFSLSLLAQEEPCACCVRGRVLDAETKESIPYATVQLSDTNRYTQTDTEGYFLFKDICPKEYALIISCIGYSNTTSNHHHEDDEHLHFYLEQSVTGLEEVLIKAERVREEGTETLAQVTVSKAQIKSNPTQSLAASLSQIEGVTFASVGANVQLPIIHGLSGNRILVLNNGLKHGFQNWGSEHSPEINISAANNITVVKGAAGVKYGPEALGGAVLVESNPLLLDNPFYANVGVGFQSNGNGLNSNVELGKGFKKWSYFANGSYTRIGDRSAADYNLTNTGKEEAAFGTGILFHHNDWDFKVYYSYVSQDLGLLRASFVSSPDALIQAFNATIPAVTEPFSYAINEPNQVTQHHLVKGEVNWWYSDKAKLSFTGGVQLNQREEFDVRRNANLPIIDLDLLTYDYQLEWEHPSWNNVDGLIGVQYFSQRNENNPGTQVTPFIPNYNTDRVSAFAIEKVNISSNTLEIGARIDIETNDVAGREPGGDIFRDIYTFTNLTASVGYDWEISEKSNFKTNIGSAFRTPNVAELFSFGQQGFRSLFGLLRSGFDEGTPQTSGVTLLSDSDVDLERGYKLSNEFRTSSDGSAHVLTTYINYIENFVFERPITVFGTFRGPQTAFFFEQADALFMGLDYTWRKRITKKTSVTYGLSYLWSRNIGEDEPLINQPPISTNLELQWNQQKFLLFDSSVWTLKPSYTFKQFQAPRTVALENIVNGAAVITPDSEIFDFTDPPDGYFLIDLTWNFKWNKLDGTIAAQNLLNTSYRNYLNENRYFADDLGRNILCTLNYNF